MYSIIYLFNSALQLLLYLLILRVWMQLAKADFYNPLTQFIAKVTNPIIKPFKTFIPNYKSHESATYALIYAVAVIKFLVIFFATTQNVNFSPFFLIYSLLVVVNAAGRVFFWILIIRAILSWLNHKQQALESVLTQLSEPIVSPIRKRVPPIANIDVSISLCFVALIVINVILLNAFSPFWAIISI